MLDLRQIREDPQAAREALGRRGLDPAVLDEALELDDRRRALLPELEELRARKNQASKRIGELQRDGEDAAPAIAEVKSFSAREKELESELREIEERRTAVLDSLPNLPDPTAAAEDEVIREVGEAGGSGRNHVELLGDNLDMERAARVSGSRFAYLKGPLVRLELALVGWALSLLEERGFTPVIPPVLVREHALYGTGQLPDTEQQIYRVDGGRSLPRGHLGGAARLAPRDGDARRGRAAAALRGLLALLPARGRGRRQGHAGALPRAPVRQGRDVHVRRAGASRRRSTSGCSRSRRRSSRRSRSRTAW